jgi:hypothetical protein
MKRRRQSENGKLKKLNKRRKASWVQGKKLSVG